MTAQYDMSRYEWSEHEWARYWYLLITQHIRSLGIDLPVGADFPSPEYMRDIGRYIVDGAARTAAERVLKQVA